MPPQYQTPMRLKMAERKLFGYLTVKQSNDRNHIRCCIDFLYQRVEEVT